MIADYEYYKTEYHGIVIQSAEQYDFLAGLAGDELANFVSRIPNTEEAQKALKRCACRCADIFYQQYASSGWGKSGGKLASESVNGYYSVSYAFDSADSSALSTRRALNAAIALYLGKWVLGARPVMM